MAYRTLEQPKKAQNGLKWLQKYCFLVLYEVQLHISIGTFIVLKKYQIIYNVYWDHSRVEVIRRLCYIMLDYQYYFPILSITLAVAWQLLLLSCNAKVMQPPCCNSLCKSGRDAPYKFLCWQFGISTTVCILLRLILDVCLTCCGTILYLINHRF